MKIIKIASEITYKFTEGDPFPCIKAWMNGIKVGEAYYSLNFPKEGELNIEWIEVSQQYRRNGIASSMIKKLQELNPSYEVVGRATSDASSNMFHNMGLKDRRGT